MKIASWNINSVRIRTHLLEILAKEHAPDVIALQEIKVEDAHFPYDTVRALGYPHLYVAGQKGYHGVALLSKHELKNVHTVTLLDRDDRRHIAATLPGGIELHNFYVPAGGDIPDRVENPYYGFKLDYITAMREWFGRERKAKDRMVMVGDMNVAPLEHDVWSHKQLLKVVSHTPDEVERFDALQQEFSWIDSARRFTPPSEKLYSWWSYRNRDWKASNRGRRLDHIWLTEPLGSALQSVDTLSHARDWDRASDHVPIIVTLNDAA